MMLYFLLFNIAPTIIELGAICVIFFIKFGAGMVGATLVIVAVYITFTRKVTDWRAQIQRDMNDVDNKAIGRAIDSLLNYETVKYFGAEEREARRYDRAMGRYEEASVKAYVSLAVLNAGQATIFTIGLAAVMVMCALGIRAGTNTIGDLVLIN